MWVSLWSLAILLFTVHVRGYWLPWFANVLIVEDTLRPADLIAVFAGNQGNRASHAAELYKRGLAPRVLVTGELTASSIEIYYHKRVTGAELSAKVLMDQGVPQNAVIVIPKGTSTYEEAQAIKQLMEGRGYHSVIAVSSPYHMRRVRATMSHLLRSTDLQVQYSPEKSGDFEAGEWWTREKDLIEVTNEYFKLAYYYLALF